MSIFTFSDFTTHLADFLSGSGDKDARDYRRSAVLALKEIADLHPWSYYVSHGRLNVFAPYTTGTIQYDSSTRTVTLTDGTWPSWAIDGTIDMDGFRCEVETVPSSTTLTLTERSSPPGDIDAGTEYSLYRDSYLVPADFFKPLTRLRPMGAIGWGPEYVEPHLLSQYCYRSTYTIVGSSNYQGAMAFRFDPPPSTDLSYDYYYRRTPRELRVEEESAGTIAVAATTAVTGTGTAFTDKHVGCTIRLSADTDKPTGVDGDNPADVERVILSVESATSLTVDSAFPDTVSGRGYTISDPVDIAPYMQDFLLRTAEYRLAMLRNRMDGLSQLRKEREEAHKRCAASDSKSAGRRWCGRGDEFGYYDGAEWVH